MNTRFLLPVRYNLWGWILFIPFSILGIVALFTEIELSFLDAKVPSMFHKEISLFSNSNSSTDDGFQLFAMVENNLTNELLAILILLGCVFLTFSKQKDEDEFISQKRLESLLWATFVNAVLLLLSIVLFYDLNFFNVMVFNLYSLFILFIFHFNISMRNIKKGLE